MESIVERDSLNIPIWDNNHNQKQYYQGLFFAKFGSQSWNPF